MLSLSFNAYGLYKGLTPERLEINKTRYAKTPTVQSEIEYFKSKAARVTTPDEFLKDYRLLKFALTAYQMEDQLDFSYRIKTIMKDDASKSDALVNRMNSAGYREINKDFDFFKGGVTKLKDSKFIDGLIKKFSDAKYETSLGELNPDLSQALYFERKITSVKNGYEIMGDRALFEVARTAANMPLSAVTGKTERVKAALESKIDMTRLTDKAYVKKLVERFLVLKELEDRQNQGGGLIDMFA